MYNISRGNPFYSLAKCMQITFQEKERIRRQKMKMKLQVIFLLTCVLFELMLVHMATSSPVPQRNRPTSMHGKGKASQVVEKCPTLTYCTCKERTVDLDITCNGINTQNLKVTFLIFETFIVSYF